MSETRSSMAAESIFYAWTVIAAAAAVITPL